MQVFDGCDLGCDRVHAGAQKVAGRVHGDRQSLQASSLQRREQHVDGLKAQRFFVLTPSLYCEMPAPPFSSFPPSFSSFPDLEAGSSSRRADERSGSNAKLSNSKELRHAKKQRGRESCEIAQGKKDKQKQRASHATGSSCIADKHSSGAKHQSSSKHHEVEKDTFLEDERLARAPETRSKLFFSDHKGDSLNVVYGGLHSGAVPKYSLIQRTLSTYIIVGG